MVLYGNYIVIDHLNGEFSLFGHLKQSSATVSIGEMIPQNHAIAGRRIGQREHTAPSLRITHWG